MAWPLLEASSFLSYPKIALACGNHEGKLEPLPPSLRAVNGEGSAWR